MNQLAIVDTEWTGLNLYTGAKCWFVNERTNSKNYIFTPDKAQQVLDHLKDKSKTIVCHNSIYDLPALARLGSKWKQAIKQLPANRIFDTLGASHCFRSDIDHSLKDLAKNVLHTNDYFIKDLNSKDYESGNIPKEYMIFDLVRTHQLAILYQKAFQSKPNFNATYKEFVEPITKICIDMKERGLSYNTEAAKILEEQILVQLIDAEDGLRACHLPSDLRPTQLGKIANWVEKFFNTRLPRTDPTKNKTGKSSPSLSQKLLVDYAPNSEEEAKFFTAFSKWQHAMAAYNNLERYGREISSDGLIHAELNPFGTVTFRFSSNQPNIQNIPKREEKFGPQFRQLFYPVEGWIAQADLDSIEMRIFAHYSADEKLINDVLNADPHISTAVCFMQVLGIKLPKKLNEFKENPKYKILRDAGKHINFARLYGAGLKQVRATWVRMSHIPISLEETKLALSLWDTEYPQAKQMQDECADEVKSQGYVENEYGMRIYADSKKAYVGTNYKIQSTVACIIRRAMKSCEKQNVLIGNQIHDELWTIPYKSKKDAEEAQHILVKSLTQDQDMFRIKISAEAKLLRFDEKIIRKDN